MPSRSDPVINRGDIFWIAADDSREPISSFPHPHVVVQDDVFNHSRITTVVVCALTSNLKRAQEPGNVLLEVGEGNLPRQSVAVSQISSVEKSRLGERIGACRRSGSSRFCRGRGFSRFRFWGR